MILHGNTLISLDILETQFICNLPACKGLCCSEGDYGAPLELEEIAKLSSSIEKLKPLMPRQAIELLQKEGFHEKDIEDADVTKCLTSGDCIFALREKGIYRCVIEKAFEMGIIDFRKPISCHLYPIRLRKMSNDYISINYNEWDICKPACILGREKKNALYIFLKDALIRRFGKKWYAELQKIAKEYLDNR